MSLTEKQKAYCIEYVSNGYNAINAYISVSPDCAAGSARNGSYRYMKNPEIKAYLAELIGDIYEAKMISAETIASELAIVAFQRRESLKEDYSEGTKLKALELLQKQLGLQTQKIEQKIEQVVFMGSESLED